MKNLFQQGQHVGNDCLNELELSRLHYLTHSKLPQMPNHHLALLLALLQIQISF